MEYHLDYHRSQLAGANFEYERQSRIRPQVLQPQGGYGNRQAYAFGTADAYTSQLPPQTGEQATREQQVTLGMITTAINVMNAEMMQATSLIIREQCEAVMTTFRQMLRQSGVPNPAIGSTPHQHSPNSSRGVQEETPHMSTPPFCASNRVSPDLEMNTQQPVVDVQTRGQTGYNDALSRQNKMFKSIMSTPGKVFSGTDPQEYKPWKEALQRELAGLAISPAQWMDLLLVRTSQEARTVVQHTRVLYLETGPEVALECVW